MLFIRNFLMVLAIFAAGLAAIAALAWAISHFHPLWAFAGVFLILAAFIAYDLTYER